MATKPTIALARFADGVGADKTAPDSGLRDTGFVGGSIIAEDFVNELFFQNYSWALYLNDGALTGNHTITGTLGVSSALTVTSGGLVVSAGGAAITGNSTVTGTLAVSAGVSATTVTASGVVTANAGVTAGTNQNVTVSGTGDFKHGDRVLQLPGCAATPSTNWTIASGKATSSGSGNIPVSLPLKQGDRLKSITFKRSGNGTVDMQADILKQTSVVGSDSSIGATTVNNVASGDNDTTVTVTSPAALASGECEYLNVFASEAGLSFGVVRITYDRP